MTEFNPMMLLQMLKGKSPKDMVMNMIQNQMSNNPVVSNMMNLANSGDKSGVETVARNLFKTQGRDFNAEFSEFMKMINKK
ncbi:MAG: hypothetical protein K2N51_16900 [Lachnospiraceae bacterium]|nr:hypothetical protein [Lachnospiraceae bacterium]